MFYLEKRRIDRNHGIDLLRIIAMLMVVILHVILQGGIEENVSKYSVKWFVVWFLIILCSCSVNVFGLISGYCGVDKKFYYIKIYRFWMVVFFYTLCGFLLFNRGTLEEVLRAFFPICMRDYWYVTAYITLCCLMPLLNHIVVNCKKDQIRFSLISLFFLWSIVSQMPYLSNNLIELQNGFSVIWLMYLYILGGVCTLIWNS